MRVPVSTVTSVINCHLRFRAGPCLQVCRPDGGRLCSLRDEHFQPLDPQMCSVPSLHSVHPLQSRFPQGFWILNSKFLTSALKTKGSHIWGLVRFAVCQYFGSARSTRVNVEGWVVHLLSFLF